MIRGYRVSVKNPPLSGDEYITAMLCWVNWTEVDTIAAVERLKEFRDTFTLSINEGTWRVKTLASFYHRGHPKLEEDENISFVTALNKILSNKHIRSREVEKLGDMLQYRLGVMEQASYYTAPLRIGFPDCEDGILWQRGLDGLEGERQNRYHQILEQTKRFELFDKPSRSFEGQDCRYRGYSYLATMFTVIEWSDEQVKGSLQKFEATYVRSNRLEMTICRLELDQTLREPLKHLAKYHGRCLKTRYQPGKPAERKDYLSRFD